ncbi:glycoside hydrolase [Lactarius akahatsu]|uniref:Alpha-amylase n=1 Tax=Lactarius akahatsu TaxID=416441 RepID=A0AAD4QFV1_9AGAM|nr:glycoside hydrolase [Lactarius akahatsu]
MKLSLFSILTFVSLVHAKSHAARSPSLNKAHSRPLAAHSSSVSKAVIAQMFEWTWDSVAAECTTFLGPAGYAFVQVSPAQEHVQGPEWWTDYQPVSYTLTSKRGTRAQYANMISTCHAVGVGVIADTLWNHMSQKNSGVGVAGSNFTHYNYPGIYQYQDFHHCGGELNDNIVNYGNKTEVWTCQLNDLADLATDTDYVRQQLATYTNDLISLGVDGLRLDASKHMDPNDIANILTRLTTRPYITQEVIYGAGEPVTPALYIGNGDVQEFRYTYALKDAFLTGSISSLQELDNRGWVAGSGANAFVSNHDTERNKASLNAYSPSNAYILATVFSLAHPYSRPSVLSSYTNFYNNDAGAPNSGTGTCTGNVGTNGWFCQHRWQAIAGMVGFRNQVGSAPLTGWISPSSQRIAFSRGSLGFVAINNADSEWSATFMTGLPAGSYCNVVDGTSVAGVCTGTAFTISNDGCLVATVGARQAIAVHVGALGSGTVMPKIAQQVPVLFYENATTTYGDNIFVVGSVPQLGNWDPSNAIPLDPSNYPVWAATVYLPPNTAFQYKFIRKESNGNVVWESDPDRQDTTPASGTQSIVTSWR